MKTTFVVWLLPQGSPVVLTLLFACYFAWKTDKLEARLDACQNAKIDQVVSSTQTVVNAVETLIGKLENADNKTRFKR